jgi:hypothetical protein
LQLAGLFEGLVALPTGFIFRAFSKASAARASPSCLSGECSLRSLRIELARAHETKFQAEIFGSVCPVGDDTERKMQEYGARSSAPMTLACACRHAQGAYLGTLQPK